MALETSEEFRKINTHDRASNWSNCISEYFCVVVVRRGRVFDEQRRMRTRVHQHGGIVSLRLSSRIQASSQQTRLRRCVLPLTQT